MDESIKQLTELVQPPVKQKDASGDWKEVEKNLGLSLPADYKQYVEAYGSGTMCSLIWIQSPFNCVRPTRQQPMTAREYWLWWIGIYDHWQEPSTPKPYPVYPEIPGLFPFGIYGDVDVMSWYTSGDPDEWSIVYMDREQGFIEVDDLGLLEFILAALNGTLPLPESIFGKEITNAPRQFQPD